MYNIEKTTNRVLTINFKDDNDFCLFIKGIAQIDNLTQFPMLQYIFHDELEKIIIDDELRKIYDNISYPF
jgi:hypothetical protein